MRGERESANHGGFGESVRVNLLDQATFVAAFLQSPPPLSLNHNNAISKVFQLIFQLIINIFNLDFMSYHLINKVLKYTRVWSSISRAREK